MVKEREELAMDGQEFPTSANRLRHSEGLTPYNKAMTQMMADVDEVAKGASDLFWFLEHEAVLTAGTSAKTQDLLNPEALPVMQTGRGGEYTYHGPGQRIVYAIVDLKQRGNDVRRHVASLEQVIIDALANFGLSAFRREDRVGVWVPRPEKPKLPNGEIREDKIAALGIRVSRGIAFHGLSINHEPDLSHYETIVPCGIEGHGITSLVDLGYPISMSDLDISLQQEIERKFGALET